MRQKEQLGTSPLDRFSRVKVVKSIQNFKNDRHIITMYINLQIKGKLSANNCSLETKNSCRPYVKI